MGAAPAPAHVLASIDVGSSSLHLLVAERTPDGLRPVADESIFLGLGQAIVERGHLGADAIDALVVALGTYVTDARALGASQITIVATDPLRRAGDGVGVVAAVDRAIGLPLHVLTHEEEAYLTAIGVTGGRAVDGETAIIDVGGGSSEVCLIAPDRHPVAMGLRLGAERLTRHHVRHDPPTPDEITAMAAEAATLVAALPEGHPGEIIAVGGTVSNLLKVVRSGAREGRLTRDDAARGLALLGAEPADASAERFAIRPIRSRILPAGAVIIEAILARFGADAVHVMDAGIREGAILAADAAGRAWRDRLPVLARGWLDPLRAPDA